LYQQQINWNANEVCKIWETEFRKYMYSDLYFTREHIPTLVSLLISVYVEKFFRSDTHFLFETFRS
jgi:hypothetical protein